MSQVPRYALVRPLPQSFSAALQQRPTAIDVGIAQGQHEQYTSCLRTLVDQVIVVPVDEAYPDCCFIEDTAIAVGTQIVMARIGAESRRGESSAVYSVLKKLQQIEPSLKIHRLTDPATLDGGDVLQIAGKIFVGLSQRTNAASVDQLREVFGDRIVSVPVAAGLHLKSLLSALDDTTLLVADHVGARAMAATVLESLPFAESVIIPDIEAANILRVGATVLIQEGFVRSEAVLQHQAAKRGLHLRKLSMSELIKADGALTCCSLLLE